MGSSVYLTNQSLHALDIQIVRQGPTNTYSDDVTNQAASVSPGQNRVDVLDISRGFTLAVGDALDTFEVQIRIGDVFLGAAVLMMNSRGQPLKNALFWAIRSAGSDITGFRNDDSPDSLSYHASGFDVTITISGESHGLGFYDVLIDVAAVQTRMLDVIVDLSMHPLVSTTSTYPLSITSGTFSTLLANGQLSTPQTSTIVKDGTPLHLKVTARAGAMLSVIVSEGNPFVVPLDKITDTALQIKIDAGIFRDFAPGNPNSPMSATFVSNPIITSPPGCNQIVPINGVIQQDINPGDVSQRQWLLDTFGGMLAYAAESSDFIWNGFTIVNPRPSLVRAQLVNIPGGTRVVFSGYFRGNPVFRSGFFGNNKGRFVALISGGGTLDGAVAAVRSGIIPSAPSIIMYGISKAYQLSTMPSEEASVTNILQTVVVDSIQYQAVNAISAAITSALVSVFMQNNGQNRPKIPVLLMVAVSMGSQFVSTCIVDYTTDYMS